MVTLFDRQPDKIQYTGGRYLFTYSGGVALEALPIEAEFTVIYSPRSEQTPWCSVRFQVVPGDTEVNEYRVIKQRDLQPAEVVHFEQMIARQGW